MVENLHRIDRHQLKIRLNPHFLEYYKSLSAGTNMHTWVYGQNNFWGKVPAFLKPHTGMACFVCLFVCWNKPEIFFSASCVGRKVNPLGVITHGQRHRPRAYQRQRYRPRTCQSMVNTPQVDGLARIPGLTPAPTQTHPQPPNGVPPCLV